MTAIDHLNHLDSLILDHTKPPVTVTLRNQLSVAQEQVEALHAEHLALKNAHTVLKNTSEREITHLKEENAKLIATNALIVAENLRMKGTAHKRPRPPGHATGEVWKLPY